jgi:hypothetical protein
MWMDDLARPSYFVVQEYLSYVVGRAAANQRRVEMKESNAIPALPRREGRKRERGCEQGCGLNLLSKGCGASASASCSGVLGCTGEIRSRFPPEIN